MFHILHLNLPRTQLVSSYTVRAALSCFRVRELPGLCESNVLNGIAGNIGEREGLMWERGGNKESRGRKEGITFFSLSPSPSPRFPSASRYSFGQNVSPFARKERVPTHIRRHRVSCGAGLLYLTYSQN